MPLFKKPAFMSGNRETEIAYTKGVMALQQSDFYTADRFLREAAAGGHVSAYFNLSLMHGGGHLTPYDIDFAAECFYKAAAGGHPSAQQSLGYLEGADRGGFGTQRLAQVASTWASGGGLNHLLMMCACRFNEALCRTHNAFYEVVAYELDAASASDDPSVLAFLRRTGADESFYSGGLNKLTEGLAGDQITDGLNQLHLAMRQSGMSEAICRMARCTIVGYIISKSHMGWKAEPLLGLDRFFEAPRASKPSNLALCAGADEDDVSPAQGVAPALESGFVIGGVAFAKLPGTSLELVEFASKLTEELGKRISTEQDIYWYVIEQYDKIVEYGKRDRDIEDLISLDLFEIEYLGRKSENSYVGVENPGIAFIYDEVAPKLKALFKEGKTEIFIAGMFEAICDGLGNKLDELRLKYAIHYHDNCVSMQSWRSAERWSEVISQLGGE